MIYPPADFGVKFSASTVLSIVATSACMLCFSSCEKALPDKMEIPETRPVFSTEGDIPTPTSANIRFGSKGHAGFSWVADPPMFSWTAPPGWVLMPPTEFREVNFTFGPQKEGECYLAMTSGGEGATAAEFKRWRGQMGIVTPLEDFEVSALPKEKLFNHDVPFVDLTGDYTPAMAMNMPAGAPKPPARPDYRLLGFILEVPTNKTVLTLKLVGPKALVAGEVENFKAFANSLGLAAAR